MKTPSNQKLNFVTRLWKIEGRNEYRLRGAYALEWHSLNGIFSLCIFEKNETNSVFSVWQIR